MDIIRTKTSIGLLDLTRDELQALVAGWGEPGYRADQIWQWLYRRFVAAPEEMTDLPKSLRTRLAEGTHVDPYPPWSPSTRPTGTRARPSLGCRTARRSRRC